MDKSSEIVALLKEQNVLLQKLYDAQTKTFTAQQHRDLFQIGLRLLPLLLVLAFLGWLYWSFSTTLNELTSQVTDIRESVNSVFGLLTDQFSKMETFFQSLLTGFKTMFPNIENFPNLIKDQFLSS